ncbi:MAG: TolC family protein, partial [Verrucomicrobia bacterium]|nr:TolC family protein [Cytophagales bacterium]
QTKKWTLQECIDYAWQNSITIKQNQLIVLSNQANLTQAKMGLYPNLNASTSYSYNQGRSQNPFTGVFDESIFKSYPLSLSSSVTIFGGLQQQNLIKQNRLIIEASQETVNQVRQNVALNVALAYLNVLTNRELVDVSKQQVATDSQQIIRTERLVAAGSLPVNNLYDLQSQLANDEFTLVTNQNNLAISKVNLMQAMNLPVTPDFEVQNVELAEPDEKPYDKNAAQVYDIALSSQPSIRSANLQIESAKRGVAVARGSLLPSLTFGGRIGVSPTNANQTFTPDGTFATQQQVTSSFVTIDNQPYNLTAVTVQPNGTSSTIPYFKQYESTLNRGFNLTLNVPIFNNWQSRTRVSLAAIQQKTNELAAEQARLDLRQTIEQAYNNMTAAGQQYRSAKQAVRAQEQSFVATKARFDAGLLNSVDFSLSQTNLGRAKANLVQAKYGYVFRTKILDFYQNKPLTF